jgi:neutral ceramidase
MRSFTRKVRLAATAAVLVGTAGLPPALPAAAAGPPVATHPYLVGRGVSDATGEVAEVGMMGYADPTQVAEGLHTRLRSRAFVIVDRVTGNRVLLIIADSPMIFSSVRQRVLRGLVARYGKEYSEQNVLIAATHSHAGPGGYSHHLLYNLTTQGYHEKTFDAITDGMLESVERAHADLAPSALRLTHGELHDANVNRSREAFENNPESDKAFFPEGRDPQTSVLRIERDGRPVGAINWFPSHNTAMSVQNKLISADHKGYAAYHWEREVHDVDYLAAGNPDFISAFAQTNAGDMSPNVELKPTDELPAHEFEHTRDIGLKEYTAAAGQLSDPGKGLAGVDSRLSYIDLSAVTVRPEFTGDGKEHKTCKPAIGAGMAAGSTEDNAAIPTFNEGENPLWDAVSGSVLYTASPELKDCQAPKGILVPIGEMNKTYPWVQEEVPVQLVRIGGLYLVGIPGEVTITSGLRIRRSVAQRVGADVKDVLIAGYANSYIHYVTTPEEYDKQNYEGGSTLFGRWEQPALQQTAADLAGLMRDGEAAPLGPVPPDLSGQQLSLQPGVLADAPPLGKRFGDVLTQPAPSYPRGQQAKAVFIGAHPGNDLHQNSTYLDVQRWDGSAWRRIADDGDWSTKFRWARDGIAASTITVTWDIPSDVVTGRYRILYHGDAKDLFGRITPFTGVTRTFTVDS